MSTIVRPRLLVPIALGVALLFAMTSVASAHLHGERYGGAQFDTACAAAGGEVVGNGSGKTCVVVSGGGTFGPVPAGNPNWTVSGTIAPTTSVYTWENGSTVVADPVVTGGQVTITECRNNGGHLQDLGHQHCVIGS